jgi:hypothetical protein
MQQKRCHINASLAFRAGCGAAVGGAHDLV